MFVMQPWIQTWLGQSPDFFAAIRLAIAKDPHTPVLLVIGGGLLFSMVADIGTAWLGSGGPPTRKLQGGFSLEKGGPVAHHFERGHACLRSGDADRAIESFSKALRLNPSYAGALIGRGLALCKKGDYENAMADLSEAIYLDPKSAKAYFYRGNILDTKGDYAGAIADYDCALRHDPGQKRVRNARELAVAKMGDAKA